MFLALVFIMVASFGDRPTFFANKLNRGYQVHDLNIERYHCSYKESERVRAKFPIKYLRGYLSSLSRWIRPTSG